MSKVVKHVTITLEFEDVTDEDGYTSLKPTRVLLNPTTTLDEDEMSALGEEIAQSDRWQVDNWIAIQAVLSGELLEEELR